MIRYLDPLIFINLYQLKKLVLDRNYLMSLHSDTFHNLYNLQELNLSQNSDLSLM